MQWTQVGPVSVAVDDYGEVACCLVQQGFHWVMYDKWHQMHQIAPLRVATLSGAQQLAAELYKEGQR